MNDFFEARTRLSANPHFYDYLHCLVFEPDGSVQMVDGGGQLINTAAKGKYRISQTEASFDIHFSKLVETNPYQGGKIISQLADFSVSCQKQEGLFAFRREVVWRIEDETKWPCLLYRARYVFTIDPLEFGNPNQAHNLYFMLENKDFRNSTLFYYADCDERELPANELDRFVAQNQIDVCWPVHSAT